MMNPGTDQTTVAEQDVAPLKAVLIVGREMDLGSLDDIHKDTTNVETLYNQDDYLLIRGSRSSRLAALDYSALKVKGRIGPNTRIYISAHGMTEDGIHRLNVDGFLTKDFLKMLAEFSDGKPLNIHLNSCYGGAAAADVSVLPAGSVLVVHAPAYSSTSTVGGNFFIFESGRDLSHSDIVDDFTKRFALNVMETATISIHKQDGTIFTHTVRPPRRHQLTMPGEIVRYLEFRRSEFITAYNQAFEQAIDINSLPKITKQEAETWKYGDYLLKSISHPAEFVGTVRKWISEEHSYSLSNYINAPGEGKTPLMLAVISGDDSAVAALLASPEVDVNAKDMQGYTALMAAAINGNEKVLAALLASPKVDVTALNMQNEKGHTALMLAVMKGNEKAVSSMLKFDKVVLTALTPNEESDTALTLALESNAAKISKSITTAISSRFAEAIENNNAETFNSMLLSIEEAPQDSMKEILRAALRVAVMNDRVEMFGRMLPNIAQHEINKVAKDAFKDIIVNNKVIMFDKILPLLLPSYGLEVFIAEAVKNTRVEMINKILSLEKLSIYNTNVILLEIVKNKDVELFDKILSLRDLNSYDMKEILIEIIKNNRVDLLGKLPVIGIGSYGMGDILLEAVKNNRVEMFDKLILFGKLDSYGMKEVLLEALKNNRVEIFDKLLTFGELDSHGTKVVLLEVITNNQVEMLDKLPIIEIEQYNMKEIWLEAIKNNRVEMFDKLMTFGKLDLHTSSDILIEAIKNNRVEMFDKMLSSLSSQDYDYIEWKLENTAKESGNQVILDKIQGIQQSKRVNIQIDTTPTTEPSVSKVEQIIPPPMPEATIHLPPIAPMIGSGHEPETSHQTDKLTSTSYPALDSLLMLGQVVFGKLFGFKAPSKPAQVDMPAYIDQPARPADEPSGDLVSTVTITAAERTPQSEPAKFFADKEKSKQDDDMPKLTL